MPKSLERTAAAVLVFAVCATAAPAQDAKLLWEAWDAAYLQGSRAGHVRTYVEEVPRNGTMQIRATIELRISVKRFNQIVHLGMESGDWETVEGRVLSVFTRHYLGKNKQLDLVGVVEGDMLRLSLDKNKPLQPAPWNDKVLGVYRQQRLLQEKDVKPGDTFSYLSFEPSINLVVNTKVETKNYEQVELFGGKEKRKLLKVVSTPEKIQNVQLPPLVAWLGDDLMPLRSEAEIPGLGRVTLYRTTKAVALNPAAVGGLTDIGLGQFVRMKKPIARPYETSRARYRITIRDEDDPATTFSQDERQKVLRSDGNTIELEVRARGDAKETPAPSTDFLESSYFINCKDARVRESAKKAAGAETDPWKKAQRIEKWVNLNMKVVSHEALATADHVARTLTGDCTEFAMLTAAMCRAEGIPSRTALGLIYADVRSGPVFAFHMWAEVWVEGEWRALDATLGRGGIGATHLKISDQSWHDMRAMTPLLPVIRVLGRVSIEVLSTE
ncbi:MAG: transglutaminase family protein [Gemmataceae bacterium]|nr:transglutaminase family protein [Gemmataceae bacterium]MCI0743158.1 transglutaminase family protein [Gemmataceae bacterium]